MVKRKQITDENHLVTLKDKIPNQLLIQRKSFKRFWCYLSKYFPSLHSISKTSNFGSSIIFYCFWLKSDFQHFEYSSDIRKFYSFLEISESLIFMSLKRKVEEGEQNKLV
jgi:hypothetical protein